VAKARGLCQHSEVWLMLSRVSSCSFWCGVVLGFCGSLFPFCFLFLGVPFVILKGA
jgi:hypothetical protein